MRRDLTEFDKLECAEYTLKILYDALTNHGKYHGETCDWLDRAGDEVRKRRAEYLTSRHRLGL